VKLKSLVVITLLVIGCSFASAQTFGFATTGGAYLYCNYEQLVQLSPYAVWQGVDNFSACGLLVNGTIVGISGKISKAQNPLGFALKGVTYADNLYDAFYYFDTGAQWDVTSNLKCYDLGAKKPKLGWMGLASSYGYIFGDNFGVLSCDIPGKSKAPVKGIAIGGAKAPKKSK